MKLEPDLNQFMLPFASSDQVKLIPYGQTLQNWKELKLSGWSRDTISRSYSAFAVS